MHQIRSSTRFVSWKDIKLVTADLKQIYTSVTMDEAEDHLLQFAEKRRKQYPSCVKSWEEHWDVLTAFYEYPPEIRKITYTANIIERLNRQFRQITKNKPSFTNDDSLRRMLYTCLSAHSEALTYQVSELGPGAQPAGDPVRRTDGWLIPSIRISSAPGTAFTP